MGSTRGFYTWVQPDGSTRIDCADGTPVPVGDRGRLPAGIGDAGGPLADRRPFDGVSYSTRVETEPRLLRMHVAQIDLQAPGIRFKVSPPGGERAHPSADALALTRGMCMSVTPLEGARLRGLAASARPRRSSWNK